MEIDSIIRVLTEMRLLESFIASVAIVIFIGAVITLVMTVKPFVEKHLYRLIKGGKTLDSPS